MVFGNYLVCSIEDNILGTATAHGNLTPVIKGLEEAKVYVLKKGFIAK